MHLTGYEVYCLFFALKNHFTQKGYDYFKYKGRVNFTMESFLSRKDRLQFEILARKYHKEEMEDFIIGNLLAGKLWAVDFLMEDAKDNYMAYMKRKQSLSYIFSNDVNRLFSDCDPKQVFKCKNGQYPKILNEYLSQEISLETIIILNNFVDFFHKFDTILDENDVIWSKIRLLAEKLSPFMKYDKNKMKEILKNVITK